MKTKFRGLFVVRCTNPDGSLAWEECFPNGVTNAGLTYLIGAGLGGATPISSWYLGLIDLGSFSALAATDTMPSHPGWKELTTFTNGARVGWDPGGASGNAISGPGATPYTMTGSGTAYGAFLTSNSTTGGSAGTLFATGLFSQPRAYSPGQQISVAYTFQGVGG